MATKQSRQERLSEFRLSSQIGHIQVAQCSYVEIFEKKKLLGENGVEAALRGLDLDEVQAIATQTLEVYGCRIVQFYVKPPHHGRARYLPLLRSRDTYSYHRLPGTLVHLGENISDDNLKNFSLAMYAVQHGAEDAQIENGSKRSFMPSCVRDIR
jgi:hypothetical protein